eukprot:jgi/Phyca11/505051/fgenesh2_kg.PHYCAscaffold_10_\
MDTDSSTIAVVENVPGDGTDSSSSHAFMAAPCDAGHKFTSVKLLLLAVKLILPLLLVTSISSATPRHGRMKFMFG